jgi:hypothetical protein
VGQRNEQAAADLDALDAALRAVFSRFGRRAGNQMETFWCNRLDINKLWR